MSPDVRLGPRLIEPTNPEFPARFFDLPVPPRVLWATGRTPGEDKPIVAIVGSRAAARTASDRIHGIAAEMAHAGWVVVSGGALGIDAAAHRGALEARGATFAVLGCGIDVVYPDRHADLFRQITVDGGLMSEYGPGISPRPGRFPARNRLVAALAQAVIVGESHRGSGALITARLASALKRPLFAMSGSAGTDGLLARGAAIRVASATDVLEALGGKIPAPRPIPAGFQEIVTALHEGPASADVLAMRLKLPLGEVLGMLCEGELSGVIMRVPGGKFEVPRGH